MGIEVNYLAVVSAAVAAMVVGFVYYSPFVLGKPWMKLMGLTSESVKAAQREMARIYGISFVLALVTGYVLYHIMSLSMAFFNYNPVSTGLTSGFWVWIGFVMPVQLTEVLFSKKPVKLFGINTGYQLVSLLAMGVVIGLLR